VRPAKLSCLIAGIALSHAVLAHDARHHHEAPPPAAAKVVLRNEPLLDAAGNSVRLGNDVIGERIAVVNFIYTTCTTVCPVSSATFDQLQGKLGKDVVLVSISVDPVRDTPERLREYAARYGAGEGWVWLTGAKHNVDAVLKGFGAYAPSFEDHPAMVMVGAGASWTRLFGFPSADEIAARIHTLRKTEP
jgi:protein SCO1